MWKALSLAVGLAVLGWEALTYATQAPQAAVPAVPGRLQLLVAIARMLPVLIGVSLVLTTYVRERRDIAAPFKWMMRVLAVVGFAWSALHLQYWLRMLTIPGALTPALFGVLGFSGLPMLGALLLLGNLWPSKDAATHE